MPGSFAWDAGIRPGMLVTGIDEYQANNPFIDLDTVGEITFQNDFGETLTYMPDTTAFSGSAIKVSLWGLGAVFVFLGTAVVLRRPDLKAAVIFCVFAGTMALTLSIGPSSTGYGTQWALIVQMITLMPLGVLCLLFATSLVEIDNKLLRKALVPVLASILLITLIGYLSSIYVEPLIYTFVRPFVHIFVSALVMISVFVLAFSGSRQRSIELRQQSRIALAGIAFGTLPFIFLTLLPEALPIGSLFPVHLTVLPIGLMPAFIAYAILQHQLLGIRRLVHRGMVYVITSILLIIITSLILSILFSRLSESPIEDSSMPLVSAIILLGVMLFYPLSAVTRRLVDRLIYGDVPNYVKLIEAVRTDLLSPGQTDEVAASMAKMLVNLLKLESALIYLGDNPSETKLFAAVGERNEEVQKKIYLSLSSELERLGDSGLIEAQRQSDTFLLAGLSLPGSYFGHMVLGPKQGGDIFLPEERALIITIAPVLALAIDKSIQSQQLRELNLQITKAAERERGNIASDIHDGPLQKAILLAGVGNGRVKDPVDVARELANELREICSRLRPSILDHLGAISAIDWLLDETSKRHRISTDLSLFNMNEDERLSPDEELVIFRITQEAINNTVKHAMADSITVLLEKEDDALVLEISDDGEGFTPKVKSFSNGGFGIAGMRERIVHLNGSLEVQSTTGVGTTITARIPLNKEIRGGVKT